MCLEKGQEALKIWILVLEGNYYLCLKKSANEL